MSEFDHGPPVALARHFDLLPDPPVKEDFWFDWGPVFYRGRLNGSARVLCIASDPGPTERIAGRSLIGNAGQRVQGFLAKLGLTRSYICLNAWAHALHPSRASTERGKLDEPEQLKWRNKLYDLATGPALEAVIAFGGMAQAAVDLWSGRPASAATLRDPASLKSRRGRAPRCLAGRGHEAAPDRDPGRGRRQHRPQLRLKLHGVRLRADPTPRPAVRCAGVPRRRRLGPRAAVRRR